MIICSCQHICLACWCTSYLSLLDAINSVIHNSLPSWLYWHSILSINNTNTTATFWHNGLSICSSAISRKAGVSVCLNRTTRCSYQRTSHFWITTWCLFPVNLKAIHTISLCPIQCNLAWAWHIWSACLWCTWNWLLFNYVWICLFTSWVICYKHKRS